MTHEKLGLQLSARHCTAAGGLHTGILGELVRRNTSVSARFLAIFIQFQQDDAMCHRT